MNLPEKLEFGVLANTVTINVTTVAEKVNEILAYLKEREEKLVLCKYCKVTLIYPYEEKCFLCKEPSQEPPQGNKPLQKVPFDTNGDEMWPTDKDITIGDVKDAKTFFEKEVAKLPHDGKWRNLVVMEDGWVKDGKADYHTIRSFVNGLASRKLEGTMTSAVCTDKVMSDEEVEGVYKAAAPQEKECGYENEAGLICTRKIPCERHSPSQQEKGSIANPTDATYREEEKGIPSPSQQIDVKALLEEYTELHDHKGMSTRRGIETLVLADEKRMSEIEEIIKNNLK